MPLHLRFDILNDTTLNDKNFEDFDCWQARCKIDSIQSFKNQNIEWVRESKILCIHQNRLRFTPPHQAENS